MKFLILLLSISFSKTLIINVEDKTTGKPLKDSNVIIMDKDGNDWGNSTDQSGDCYFNNLENGIYTVLISYIGYEDYKTNIDINNSLIDAKISCELSISSILVPELNIISERGSRYRNLAGAGSILNQMEMNL